MDFKTKKKFDKWISIIKECESSGLGIYDWCKKNNISTSTFYFWKKKIEMILNNERLHYLEEHRKVFAEKEQKRLSGTIEYYEDDDDDYF